MSEKEPTGIPPEEITRAFREQIAAHQREQQRLRATPIEEALQEFENAPPPEIVKKKEKFKSLVRWAMASAEGIPWSLFPNFDLNTEEGRFNTSLLEHFWLTQEGATQQLPWLWTSILRVTQGNQERWEIKALLGQEEEGIEEAKEITTELWAELEARKVVATAYFQRMHISEDMGTTRRALEAQKDPDNYQRMVFPDRTHWETLFKGELGDKIDAALRKIVEIGQKGIKIDKGVVIYPFAEGFKGDPKNTALFFQEIVNAADNDSTAATLAWRIALLWEIPSKHGAAIVKTDNEKYKLTIGDPPIVADYYVYTGLLFLKRLIEAGFGEGKEEDLKKLFAPEERQAIKQAIKLVLRPNRERKRKKGIYYNKVGCLLSLPIATILPGCYLDHIKTTANGQEVTFFDLWWGNPEKGIKPRKLSQLPWRVTEKTIAGEDEAAPLGSFKGWAFIQRMRAISIAESVFTPPNPQKAANPSDSLARNWEKLGLPRELRKWFVLAQLAPFVPGTVKRDPYEDYLSMRVRAASGTFGFADLGNPKPEKPSIPAILDYYIRIDFLNEDEAKWVEEALTKKPSQVLESF